MIWQGLYFKDFISFLKKKKLSDAVFSRGSGTPVFTKYGQMGLKIDSGTSNERCQFPQSVVPLQGTIEFEIYIPQDFESANRNLFNCTYGSNMLAIYWNVSAAKYRFRTKNDAGTSTILEVAGGLSTGWHRFGMTYNSALLSAFMDGNPVGTPIYPSLPSTHGGNFDIGSDGAGNCINTVIRNININKKVFTATEMKERDNKLLIYGGYPVDRNYTTLSASLKSNLKLYREVLV